VISFAAVRVRGRDEVYCSPNPYSTVERIAKDCGVDASQLEYGFLTNTGDFLDRYEAALHALDCGQVYSYEYGPDYVNSGLSPEDLGWGVAVNA